MKIIDVELAGKVAIGIVNKYPADFGPDEHDFVTRINKEFNQGVACDYDLEDPPMVVGSCGYFWDKVCELWDHECGMLV